jgi:hypothetical protein
MSSSYLHNSCPHCNRKLFGAERAADMCCHCMKPLEGKQNKAITGEEIVFLPRYPSDDGVSWAGTLSLGGGIVSLLGRVSPLFEAIATWLSRGAWRFSGWGERKVRSIIITPYSVRLAKGVTETTEIGLPKLLAVVPSKIISSTEKFDLGRLENTERFRECWLEVRGDDGTGFAEMGSHHPHHWVMLPTNAEGHLRKNIACGNCHEELTLTANECERRAFSCPLCNTQFVFRQAGITMTQAIPAEDLCVVRIAVSINPDLHFRPLVTPGHMHQVLQEVDTRIGESFREKIIDRLAGEHRAICIDERIGPSDEWICDVHFAVAPAAESFRIALHRATSVVVKKSDELHVRDLRHSIMGDDHIGDRLYEIVIHPPEPVTNAELISRIRELRESMNLGEEQP